MMYNKNSKVKVHSQDGDSDYVDIVAGLLQGDALTPYLFIICLDYVLRASIDLMKENGFKLAKTRSKRYPAQTIIDADFADHIALLTNTTAQTESQQHNLKRAAGGISVHVNSDKTEYMCFNQRGDISILNCGSLKSLDDHLFYVEPIYNNSVLIQDVAWKTRRERWTIEMNGEGGPGKSILAARHNDNCGLVICGDAVSKQ